jgi:hypothetical protein
VRKTAKSVDPSELISAVYEAAVDGEAWARLPRLLADYVEGETCAIYSTAQGVVNETVTHGLNDAAADYTAYYFEVEPWLATSGHTPIFGAVRGSEILDPGIFEETEYYQDFGRRWGMFHLLGGYWPVTPDRQLGVGIHRPRDRADFSAEEFTRYAGIVPHMQRMMQLRARLSDAERTASIGFAAVDALAFAAVI